MMITILISFSADVNENRKRVSFRATDTITAKDYPDAFIDMIIAKGLAVRVVETKGKAK